MTEQTLTESAYPDLRNDLLRRQLRPTFLITFALIVVQVVTDLWNRQTLDSATLQIYAALGSVPLLSAAMTYLPSRLLAITTIATLFDLAFTLVLVSFLFAPGGNTSGVASAISLKMLASAVLVPWRPRTQLRSGLLTLSLYFLVVWWVGPASLHTHQVITPILAAILAAIGCRRLDANNRALFERSLELEASGKQLTETLSQERVLMGVANEITALTGIRSVLEKLNRANAQATQSAFSTTLLVHEDEDAVELASTYMAEGGLTHPIGTRFPDWSGSALRQAMFLGETIAVDDIHAQDLVPSEVLEETKVGVIAFSPIMSHGRLLGVLMTGRLTGGKPFNEREIAMLKGISANAAISINNARLYDELTASEAAYRDLFERANDLILVADVEGSVYFANDAALRLLECGPDQLRQLRWNDYLSESEVAKMRRRIAIATRRGVDRNATFSLMVSSPGIGEATLEVRARMISPPGQKPERFQCIARDVTERARRDEETRALLARLQESQRLQDEFVANMSHELRTPLNVIIGYADLIADDLNLPVKSDARSFLDRIGAASRALHRMVESILEYARLDRGRMTVIPTNFSSEHLLLELRALCNDVRSSLAVNLELRQQHSIEFMTDYDRLYSILSNLLLNAIKFTPRGEITLTLTQRKERAVFEVRDTGIGIEAEELRSVFEPFRQVDGSDTRAFGGVGLGLAIVRRNVDLLQGTIDVDSAPEKGTVFEIDIPIVLEGATAHRAPNAA